MAQFALDHGIPLTETIAGKGTVTHDHPAYAGPIGIVGSTSANALAAEADVDRRHRHPVDGLHHRLLDGLRPGCEVHFHQRGALGRNQAPRAGRGRRCAGIGGGTRRRPQGLEGRRRHGPPRRAIDFAAVGQGARRLPEADQRAGADLCPGGGRGEPQGRQARLHDHRRRRPAGRDDEELAGQVAEQLRSRIRLLLHGLRDRRRLGRGHGRSDARDHRHGGRRLLHDDELGHLFHRSHRPQADRRASATTAATRSSTGCRTSRAAPPSTT